MYTKQIMNEAFLYILYKCNNIYTWLQTIMYTKQIYERSKTIVNKSLEVCVINKYRINK